MGAKVKGNVSVWKPILAITAGVLVVVALFLAWQYVINRPNYYDLQKEFNKLQIPADWQLVSESSNKGVLGLFCWQIEGGPCPYASKKYISTNQINSSSDLAILHALASSLSYETRNINTRRCNISEKNYYCEISATKDNYAAILYIAKNSGDRMKKLDITLEQTNVSGIR